MLKYFSYPIIFSLILLLITSCSSVESRNSDNLLRLSKGMTKAEVLNIMGEPLRNEVYNEENVWYYFTTPKWSDGMITRDECSPVFFKDEKLEGWGAVEYKNYLHRDW